MNTTQTTLHLVREWIERFNADDRPGFTALLADDITFTQVSTGTVDRAADGVVASMWSWRALFTQIHAEIETAFASSSGDQAFLAVIWTGSRKPTSAASDEAPAKIKFPAWFLFQVRDGHIVAAHDFYDQLSYQEQFNR